jgi:hypothetical protein
MVMSRSTVRNALLSLIRRAGAYLQTLRPQRAEAPTGPATHQVLDGDPEASPPPIPETIPPPVDDVVPDPTQQLASALIPVPAPPKCQYPSEMGGHDWMLSHRWASTPSGSAVQCQDCGERWPKMEASA